MPAFAALLALAACGQGDGSGSAGGSAGTFSSESGTGGAGTSSGNAGGGTTGSSVSGASAGAISGNATGAASGAATGTVSGSTSGTAGATGTTSGATTGATGTAGTSGTASTGATGSMTGASSGATAGMSSGSTSGATTGASAGDGGTGEGTLASGIAAFPAPNATNVCPDPPLRLTFSAPPKLGTSGKIQVFNATSPATAVAALDMGATTFSNTIAGTTFNILRPAYVDGNDAVIYLNSHVLTYGQTYYVTVDSGAITGPSGAGALTGTTAWRLSTVAPAPSQQTALSGARKRAGNICSVQGAVDAVPAKNTAATTITIAPGVYHEIVHFTSKNNVTLLGGDRTTTIIEGTNNNNLNPTTVTRSLVGIDGSSGLIVDSLTIQNLTPQGGSQAEALRLETCDECVVRNTSVFSLQDTLLWDGRLYADNCLIAGNVDFVWGGGVAYFNNCEIRTVGQAGAIVQARNAAGAYGYVFVDSKLTSAPAVTGQVLARIDVSVYPGSHVAYINCQLAPNLISPAGWTITGGTPTSALRFWEYQSVDPTGKAIDVSKRIAGSTQITATQAASMRDPTVVLNGWQPPP